MNIQENLVTMEVAQSDGRIVSKNASILEAAAFLCSNLSWRIIKMMNETLIYLKIIISKFKLKSNNSRKSMSKEKIVQPTLFEIRSLFK